ncbi:MAG: hypothetical protein AB1704_20870 [Pseudomonadota bacterium]
MFGTIVLLAVGGFLVFGSGWLLKIQKPSKDAHQDPRENHA